MPNSTDCHDVATVALCTRNRRACALRAVASAFEQIGCAEVVVIDDGSQDGTSEAIRERFPAVRLHRIEQSSGVGAARSHYIRLARNPFIVVIDDDAYFNDPSTVIRTLSDFKDPRIGAIAMPMLDSGRTLQPPAPDERVYLTRYFYGGAHALRRDVVTGVGAYRSSIRFYTEESDLCIRMLDRGYVTAVGTAPPVLHESPGDQVATQRRRDWWTNDILFKWHYTPWQYLPLAMASHPLNQIPTAWKGGHVREYLATSARAMLTALGRWKDRQPVKMQTYRVWRTLASRGMVRLDELADRLPPVEQLSETEL